MVAALVEQITGRGLTVSTIKHAHHDFALDHEGTDSFKHTQAGAQEVALVSSKRWAIMHELKSKNAEPSLDVMISKLAPCDLILVEGYKGSKLPKIECIRVEHAKEPPLWKTDDQILAVASDQPIDDCLKPIFDQNDIATIADFILQRTGIGL